MRTRLAFHCVGAALIATMAACNDNAFLTEVPKDFVGPEQFYRNAADATAAINSVYAAFINGTGDGYYGRKFWMLVEYPTEAVTAGRLSGTNEPGHPDGRAPPVAHRERGEVPSRAPLLQPRATLRRRSDPPDEHHRLGQRRWRPSERGLDISRHR